jgi:hypothetical protein
MFPTVRASSARKHLESRLCRMRITAMRNGRSNAVHFLVHRQTGQSHSTCCSFCPTKHAAHLASLPVLDSQLPSWCKLRLSNISNNNKVAHQCCAHVFMTANCLSTTHDCLSGHLLPGMIASSEHNFSLKHSRLCCKANMPRWHSFQVFIGPCAARAESWC